MSDQGVGIEARRLTDLFELETNSSTCGTVGEGGSGFGLPFSQDIARAHGGALRAKSELNSGSTFYVDLPQVKPRVLLVDDDEEYFFVYRQFLRYLDVEIHTASDGREALERLEAHRPHLVVADLVMPELDGIGLLAEARNRENDGGKVPFIMVTSDNDSVAREHAFRLGADDFVNKPLSPHDFIPRVRRFLS